MVSVKADGGSPSLILATHHDQVLQRLEVYQAQQVMNEVSFTIERVALSLGIMDRIVPFKELLFFAVDNSRAVSNHRLDAFGESICNFIADGLHAGSLSSRIPLFWLRALDALKDLAAK